MEDAWHKLKLGKGVTFVKTHLRLLPQAEDTWAVALDPVLDNDADPDGDAIAIASVWAQRGTVSGAAGGAPHLRDRVG